MYDDIKLIISFWKIIWAIAKIRIIDRTPKIKFKIEATSGVKPNVLKPIDSTRG